jgi:prepilin-type N-terminal cleavage/methylation domain-containing protein
MAAHESLITDHRSPPRICAPALRPPPSAFTPEPRERPRAFTLLEMLVVIGIIAILLVAVIPAVNSISKSTGRKGAMSNVTSMIEQARSLALSDARNTYIAFATVLPAGATPQMIQDYSYRAYAVFEDTASGGGKAQVSKWQKLPTGISFRNQDEPIGTGTCLTSTTNTTTTAFSFSPLGGATTITCPYIEFDSTGAIIQPSSAAPMRLVAFEGNVSGGTENPTARESGGDPVRDEVQVERFTGRVKYVIR